MRTTPARLSPLAVFIVALCLGCGSRSQELKNAETYIEVNELAKAKELIDLELQTNPKNVEAYLMSAKVFLLMGDPPDATASFDKALLLDAGAKNQISKIYFEAAERIADKKTDAGVLLVAAYVQEAVTLDPGLASKVVDWAVKRANAESAVEKTVAPAVFLQAIAKAVPGSGDRIGTALLAIATTYRDKQFLHEAAVYAMEAGQENAAKLMDASGILRASCTLLPSDDREFAVSCLQKAMQWNPALAKDDDVYWLANVSLRNNGGSGALDYLTQFPQGKHAAEAQAITSAAEAAAKESAEQTYTMRTCDGANDGEWDAVSRDLSGERIDRFTIDLRPGCFSGYVLIPQAWEYYRMEAVNPRANWWLAYRWYQSKNSGSGENPPLKPNQLATMRHGSHKIRVQGSGQLVLYPVP